MKKQIGWTERRKMSKVNERKEQSECLIASTRISGRLGMKRGMKFDCYETEYLKHSIKVQLDITHATKYSETV